VSIVLEFMIFMTVKPSRFVHTFNTTHHDFFFLKLFPDFNTLKTQQPEYSPALRSLPIFKIPH